MSKLPSTAPHGSTARYQAERYAGLVPCDACVAGQRRNSQRSRRRISTKCAKGLGWPLRHSLPGDPA